MNSLLNPNFRSGWRLQVGETDHAQPRSDVLAHADGIRVVESERPAHPDAPLGQRRRRAASPRIFLPARISPEIVPVYSG